MTAAPVRVAAQRRRAVEPGLVATWVSIALVVIAVALPPIARWNVHANGLAPLSANWHPRLGIGTVPAVVIALFAWRWGERVARRCAWRVVLAATFGAALAWSLSLALVDGRAGLADQLDTGGYSDYLSAARQVHDVPAVLHEFISRIPAHAVGAWPTHVAGHPPGALLFFVALVRVGLGGGLAAGLVVTVLAATVPVAVLITLRALGAESAARRVTVVLALGPSAIWSAVSGDSVFAAVMAWGLCALAVAATAQGRGRAIVWALVAGLLLGGTVMMSYGLALIGVLALAVLLAARTWRVAVLVALVALGVVLAFAVEGFAWWRALPVLHDRYYAGLAHVRPASYWLWGDVAALVLCAGPVLGASVVCAAGRVRAVRRVPQPVRVVAVLTSAAVVSIVLADASLMSKAEVERIWLPFVPWLLLGVALFPVRWRRPALAAQLIAALLLQSLLFTHW